MPGASSQHSRRLRSRSDQNSRRKLRGAVTRQHATVRGDDHRLAAPAAHAGLRALGEVVGAARRRSRAASPARARARRRPPPRGAARAPAAARRGCGAPSRGTACSPARRARAPSRRARAISSATCARFSRCSTTLSVSGSPRARTASREGELLLEARRARDAVGAGGLGVLHRELHAARGPRAPAPRGPRRRSARPRSRGARSSSAAAAPRTISGEVAPQGRLAAGEAHVHHAERRAPRGTPAPRPPASSPSGCAASSSGFEQ